MHIRQTTVEDATILSMLIASAHADVAERFALNATTCPTHPSLCTPDWVLANFAQGARYFLAEDAGRAIGCVSMADGPPGVTSLNRLSVLPEHRRQGTGSLLVRHVLTLAKTSASHSVRIGIIASQESLHRWYLSLGFSDVELRTYAHLPFAVQIMARHL